MFLKHVLAVVKTGHQTGCDVKYILTYARALLGHKQMVRGLGDANFDWDWLLTCDKGQTVYPAVLMTEKDTMSEKKGS